jgi:hypothetical protein
MSHDIDTPPTTRPSEFLDPETSEVWSKTPLHLDGDLLAILWYYQQRSEVARSITKRRYRIIDSDWVVLVPYAHLGDSRETFTNISGQDPAYE